VGATANLDSSCARRLGAAAGRDDRSRLPPPPGSQRIAEISWRRAKSAELAGFCAAAQSLRLVNWISLAVSVLLSLGLEISFPGNGDRRLQRLSSNGRRGSLYPLDLAIPHEKMAAALCLGHPQRWPERQRVVVSGERPEGLPARHQIHIDTLPAAARARQ